ncbi:CYTH and CHAD domain-containing protein [Couchioplanes caeruleus]|uniref:CHAD domain containing protein n=2 Tax=Couchioplanes caeruleus TaxID=56438 RepID=A0A1K0FPN8_9ACTN|nr:CYTH and CHAD domain-containing protein [Couchioplanes caeruleus]OJF14672.1 CHAD domain containing protein [Couchioplanes caeruleus subsp. caeruleus]ROP30068.1 CHAD domain-containing protein [Couchioplanes caeruleus]
MQTATESERKYDVPAGFALPPLSGAGGVSASGEPATHELDATYFDTEDLRLARNKRTLRRRTGGTDAGWHLKTPGEGSSRTEYRLPLTGDDAVPAELVAEVRTIVRTRPLRPVATLRTRRVETPLCDADGRTLALIAQDEVDAETGNGQQRWQEIEVELVDGGPELLDAVEGLLRAAGATPAAGPSKLARALGDRLRAPQPGKAPKTDPVLGYAREQRDAIEAHDAAVRAGDADGVHKMRVGTRRLRSTLKTFKSSFDPERAEFLKDELKWLADCLGDVRDGQVLQHKLAAASEGFPDVAARIREKLEADVSRGRQALVEALNSDRYLALLDAMDALIDEARPDAGNAPRRVRKVLHRADALLDTAVGDGVDAELHDARKKYKQARYAVEVFAPAAGKPGKKLVSALTSLQDVLGAHQDSVVARELLRDVARTAPDAFEYGVLYARQERIGEETFHELPAVIKSSRRGKLRRWLG